MNPKVAKTTFDFHGHPVEKYTTFLFSSETILTLNDYSQVPEDVIRNNIEDFDNDPPFELVLSPSRGTYVVISLLDITKQEIEAFAESFCSYLNLPVFNQPNYDKPQKLHYFVVHKGNSYYDVYWGLGPDHDKRKYKATFTSPEDADDYISLKNQDKEFAPI